MFPSSQIQLVSLRLQETGTYNPQYSRPYSIDTSAEMYNTLNNLASRVGDITHSNPMAKVEAGLISGLCGHLVVPQAAYEKEVNIVNGWNEKRLRFVLEVHVPSAVGLSIYFFQGYTEYVGISMEGSIDPEMVFYINSYVQVNRAQDFSGLHSGGFRDVVVESAQVINGRFYSDNASSSVYGLRPSDIFTGIQSSYFSTSFEQYNNAGIKDDREDKSTEIMRSRRSNGIPSNFLSKVIESYRTASGLADYGPGQDDIYARATTSCYEANPYENPFIRAITDTRGMKGMTYFTMNDLAKIDPTINQRTQYQQMLATVRMHQVGDTDNNWGRPTLVTQFATILTHAIAGLMTDHLLVAVGFHITNMTIGGQYDIRFFPDSQAMTTADMRPYYANFARRLEMEIMPDVTLNNTIPVDIVVYADLNSETRIEFSMEGGPHEVYVTPSFCDSLMPPIITTNQDNYHGLVTGVEEIIKGCTEQGLQLNGQSLINTNV